MSRIDEIAIEAAVNLLRNIPWGPGRDELLAKAAKLNSEASFERGWDNYSTAARLNWNADLHQFAAEARFPREGDVMVGRMRERVLGRLSELVRGVHLDHDVSELTRTVDLAVDAAIPSLDDEDRVALIDELAAEAFLDDPDFWKSEAAVRPAA